MTGSRCVVHGCSNRSNNAAGISLHRSPVNRFYCEQWVRFVRTHRANFEAKGVFVVCSEHFQEQCFERALHVQGFRRRLLPEIAEIKITRQKPNLSRKEHKALHVLQQSKDLNFKKADKGTH